MSRWTLCLLALWSVAHAETPPADAASETTQADTAAEAVEVDATLTLLVSDDAQTLRDLRAEAERLGGWMASLDSSEIMVRVPVASVDDYITWASERGKVIERDYTRQDHSAAIADATARRAARQTVLDQYMGILDEAKTEAVVTVEREILRVVQEIERVTGVLRRLDDRTQYARVTVSLQFKDRRPPASEGSSAFDWLNSLSVQDFLEALDWGWREPSGGVSVTPPEGFAAFGKQRGRFTAVSPDDVAYRVRFVKHQPEATLAFWQEAAREHLRDTGYVLLDEGDLTSASGQPGFWLELGAALGATDQTYLVAVFDDGKRLILAEATGETTRFRMHREALLASMGQLSW